MPNIAGQASRWRDAFGRGVFPYPFAWILELPWRRLVLSPEALASRLPLSPGAQVLELGAGSGYSSAAVARLMEGTNLTLFDLQTGMLARCRRRCASAGLHGMGFVAGDAAALPFDAGRFDVVYMVTVLGEVHDQDACLRGIRRVIKPGGTLSVSEHLPDPDFVSLPALRRRAEGVGFAFERSYGHWWSFTADFRSMPDKTAAAALS